MDNPSDFPGGGRPPRKELQGPRPTALKVRKESHKIKKPPIAPPVPGQHYSQPLQPQDPPRQPVIIYTVSPKVIHTNPSDFMTLVQRLTGPDATSSSSGCSSSSSSLDHHVSGAISPAARFASIEMTKMPLESRKFAGSSGAMEGEVMEMGDSSVNIGSGEYDGMQGLERTVFFPGILSPGPGSLPPISPNLFSPFFQDPSHNINLHNNHGLSAVQHGMPNPFSSNFISPTTPVISPSSLDLLHRILNS